MPLVAERRDQLVDLLAACETLFEMRDELAQQLPPSLASQPTLREKGARERRIFPVIAEGSCASAIALSSSESVIA